MKKRNLDSELLREGYRSYHKALFAVMEFRREAGTIIKAATEKRVPELAAAMKMDGGELRDGICPYTSPDRLNQKFDGSKTDLGVRIPRDWNSKWHMYFYLWIGDGQEPFFAAQVSLKNPGSTIEKLAAECKELEYEDTYALISEIVPPDGSRDLAAVCDCVLNRWIALWEKVGGLRQFISKRV
jgi:hypothetical protein